MASISEPGTLAPSRRLLEVRSSEEEALTRIRSVETRALMADAVRALAIDVAETAGSGDLTVPLAMADVATVLWSSFLRFDSADPRWPDRDRFILSAGDGSMLLYALLHLTGHAGMDIGVLQRHGQLDSLATSQPEFGEHPAIETTAGAVGQGLATAVGIALAERMLAAKFGRSLVDHRTWVVGSDGDMMAGVSHEAACLAGDLRLEKLTVLWGDNRPHHEGNDLLRQYAAYGWTTKRVDGHDTSAIASALSLAVRAKKPTIIACETGSGKGNPVTSSAESRWEVGSKLARLALKCPHTPFQVSGDVAEQWNRVGARGRPARRSWLKRLNSHPMRAEFERVTAGRLPDVWHEATAAFKAEMIDTRPVIATQRSSQRVLDAFATVIPELVGGAPNVSSNLIDDTSFAPITFRNYSGRYIHFGVREHGMAACLNGMALHTGLVPYGAAPLISTDAMRPAIRLAALMRQQVIYTFTQDSIGLGQDGPTQQPVEHLAGLRATPGLSVLRPADAIETAECWELALRRADGPSLLVLSHQAVPTVRAEAGENRCARGGYVLAEADGPRQATLIATGSEVAVALEARCRLAHVGIQVAVVSLPCWDLFTTQDESYRAAVLGAVLRVGIEAACGFGWERWLGTECIFIGMRGFGASAPAEILFRHFGITSEAIVAAVRKRLQSLD